MRIDYDKGSILELRNRDGTYTYALCLGKAVKDKFTMYDDLKYYGQSLSSLFTDDELNFKTNVLFGSIQDVMSDNFAFNKLDLRYTWYKSETRLSKDEVINGFKKYPFFTCFYVKKNKVMDKRDLKDSTWMDLCTDVQSKTVLVYDSGIDIDFLYLKSCLLKRLPAKQLLTVKEYYSEIEKQLKVFREKEYEHLLRDVYSSCSPLLQKGEEIDIEDVLVETNKLYLVETKNQFYLFNYLYYDLYILIGRIDKNTSSKHDKTYFLSLLGKNSAFIDRERYKRVRTNFSEFLHKNQDNIVHISYFYNILNDLDLDNAKLRLTDETYRLLDNAYYGCTNDEIEEDYSYDVMEY